jgi:hypothetical protein
MRVFFVVENYADKIVGEKVYRTRKAAQAASDAVIGTFTSVIEAQFISPREQKALKALSVATQRP